MSRQPRKATRVSPKRRSAFHEKKRQAAAAAKHAKRTAAEKERGHFLARIKRADVLKRLDEVAAGLGGQSALTNVLGIKESTWKGWWWGQKATPSAEELCWIASKTGYAFKWLLLGEGLPRENATRSDVDLASELRVHIVERLAHAPLSLPREFVEGHKAERFDGSIIWDGLVPSPADVLERCVQLFADGAGDRLRQVIGAYLAEIATFAGFSVAGQHELRRRALAVFVNGPDAERIVSETVATLGYDAWSRLSLQNTNLEPIERQLFG